MSDSLPRHLMEVHRSGKRYGHEMGFSCAFRQWRAHSHCQYLHGYSLAFQFDFIAHQGELDHCGWVVDFGGLKSLKGLLEATFDHKTLVAEDDPRLPQFVQLDALGVIQMVRVEATGCEAFAKLVYEVTEQWLKDAGFSPRVALERVTVSEHGGNYASYGQP